MPAVRARAALTLLAFLAACPTPAVLGQGLEYVESHYTKHEFRIPMRDGVRLFTSVYVPKDSSQAYPILLNRTPYSVKPYGVDQYKSDLGPSPLFGTSGYIFVYQDVRGRWMSEGEFVNVRPMRGPDADPSAIDEGTDTRDTIDWLLKNLPGHNGKVGVWGISYPGFYTSTAIVDAHPAIRAASPQAPISDWFTGDDFHHNGAFFLPHAFNFYARFGWPRPGPTPKDGREFDHGTPDGYDFFLNMGPLSGADQKYFKGEVKFWNELMAHGVYDDFWKARNLRPHLKQIRPAVLVVGGWFDAENLYGALETYKAIENASPGAENRLVMGPWSHGAWSRSDGASLGHVNFRSKTAEFYRAEVELPFFESHLKGDPTKLNLPEALTFESGTNQWRRFASWPPRAIQRRDLFLREAGTLQYSASTDAEAFDTFDSDPARPVPFEAEVDIGMTKEYMLADQRFASRRPDVLVYQTPPLETDLTLAGPIEVDLHVSTTGTDADWVVKIIDVYPDTYPDPDPNPTGVRMGGFEQLIRGDVFRGKFRKGFDRPEPFKPGEPDRVKFTLPDVCHTFRPGHRLMIHVQSSWFPLVDRNPQTFVDIYRASESDFRKATHRVDRSRDRASHVTLPVLPVGAVEAEPAAAARRPEQPAPLAPASQPGEG